mgnify:CR=1 FL=1
MSSTALHTVTRPIVDENPITLQILGICSALAVTRRLDTALLMGASVVFVLTLSNLCISLGRRQIPRSVRLIVQITVIASDRKSTRLNSSHSSVSRMPSSA